MLANLLVNYWEVVSSNTELSPKQIAEQALVAPARCCLKSIEQADAVEGTSESESPTCRLSSVEEEIVGKAFAYLKEISQILRDRYGV